ncbi:SPFH domain-containing protein [Granulosicoccus sp. 3-233]|uniref:SPFH domain-containing protein n=1 Tax=Granulosicoccus sp. 3-233 TaxID=3417969 RepID=UPI003D359917
MGLFSKLFHEFVDVIEWVDDSSNTMVYRFERYGNEIKYGAKLIVREAQIAVFVNEGQVADVLGPGTYELQTKNLPILTTLQNWHHGFQSPFKAEVYFCNARRFTDMKWGTKHPLMLRDSEFGGLRIRAFGTYGVRITDALTFIREIVGTDGVFTTDEISSQLRNLITSRFATIIGSANIPVLDMAGNYDQLGEFLTRRIAPEFGEYGLELTRILVENISLPPAVSEALDKRTSMGMTGNLDRYLQYQTGAAMEAGASNPGGGASDGIGMGIGLAMANRMNDNLSSASNASPPPLPGAVNAVYHLAIDGTSRGPYSLDLLKQQKASGTLDQDTLVWTQGMAEWQPAASVAALSELWEQSAASPPPIPGA